MRKLATLAGIAAAATLLITGCGGQANGQAGNDGETADFPKAGSAIEWIVPSAAGAGNDIMARIVAPAMQEDLGANIKVVNKEGGSQVIGLNYVANAKPDGYTLGNTNIPSILGRYLDPSKQAGFDRSSFTPIGSFGANALVVSVNRDSPHQDIQDLFDAVKAAPGTVTVGTDSRGGDDHVNLAVLEKTLDLKFNIVHYNSGADKVSALLSGEVDFALGGVSSFYGQYKSGDVEVLSVIGDEPSPFTPEVPTMQSAGYDVEPMSSNFVLSVPSDTPAGVVEVLESALKAATEDKNVQEKIRGSGTEPVWISGSEISALWEEREAQIKPVIEDILTQQ